MKAFAAPVAFAALFCFAGPHLFAQAPAAAMAPSAPLRPALVLLGRNLDQVHPERWKLNAVVRDQTGSDVKSIHHDLETTLPPLLAAADATPTLVSAQLPVSRNVTALYDVLVRLVERGRPAAPQEQEAALEQARQSLDSARRTFDASLQTAATTQESLLKQLQSPPPPAPAPPAPAPAKKKTKAKPKPAPQP